MPIIKRKISKCPHCGNWSFEPLEFHNDDLVMSSIQVKQHDDIVNGTVDLKGPAVVVYYKCCRMCGYLGMFNAIVVEEKKML